jgi:hypothetical protein
MDAVLYAYFRLSSQAGVGFMNQCGGLQGMVAAFRAEVGGRNPAKIAVKAFD